LAKSPLTKRCIDAAKKIPGEVLERFRSALINMDVAVKAKVEKPFNL
jgi:hypothetical protein